MKVAGHLTVCSRSRGMDKAVAEVRKLIKDRIERAVIGACLNDRQADS